MHSDCTDACPGNASTVLFALTVSFIQDHFSVSSKYWVLKSYFLKGSHSVDRKRIKSAFKYSNIVVHITNYKGTKVEN